MVLPKWPSIQHKISVPWKGQIEYTHELFTSVDIIPSLTPTSPYSRASDTRQERGILFVNIYAANPGKKFTRIDANEQ